MPTYIEKEALMDEIEKYCGDYFCHDEDSFDKCAVRMAVKLAPTADVVPVVRCGECSHYDRGYCIVSRFQGDDHIIPMPKDGFCNYGARMNGKGGAK